MADYAQQKVPELKKLLQDRGLSVSGNKADLIARLQEADKKNATGEDEIDWDEDDKPTTTPAVAAVAAGGVGPVNTPAAVSNQKTDVDPSPTSNLKVVSPPQTAEPTSAPTTATAKPAVPEPPKENFAAGLEQTDAEKESARRAARAKRFGIPENEEAKKLAERAKKFGTGKDPVVASLDSALPERRPKRGRGGEGKGEERVAKRQTPDRRTQGQEKGKPRGGQREKGAGGKKEGGGRITDDPSEKLKAEARAKRFAKAD